VSLFEIPFGLFTSFIWQIFLEEIKQINSLLLQARQVSLGNFRLASIHIPIHARDQNLLNLGTRICNMG
jgi:hypothetical protein